MTAILDPRAQMPSPAAPGPGGVVPGPEAGQIYIPTVGWVQASSWSQYPIYDTEIITTPVAAGDEYIFFRNLSFPVGVRKDSRYTNMNNSSQLPSGWNAVVYRISFRVLMMETAVAGVFTTAEDAQRLLTQGVAEFVIGNQKTEREGPLETWPCPYGMNASLTRTGPAATRWEAVNNGVPSLGSSPPSDIVINLLDELNFHAAVVFRGAMVLDANTMLQCLMDCWIAKPVR